MYMDHELILELVKCKLRESPFHELHSRYPNFVFGRFSNDFAHLVFANEFHILFFEIACCATNYTSQDIHVSSRCACCIYTPIGFNEKVTFWLKCTRSLPCVCTRLLHCMRVRLHKGYLYSSLRSNYAA